MPGACENSGLLFVVPRYVFCPTIKDLRSSRLLEEFVHTCCISIGVILECARTLVSLYSTFALVVAVTMSGLTIIDFL